MDTENDDKKPYEVIFYPEAGKGQPEVLFLGLFEDRDKAYAAVEGIYPTEHDKCESFWVQEVLKAHAA